MDNFIIGVIVGLLACCVILTVTEVVDNKKAFESCLIKIDGETYTLRKADVVDAVEEAK